MLRTPVKLILLQLLLAITTAQCATPTDTITNIVRWIAEGQRVFTVTDYGANGQDAVVGEDHYAIQHCVDLASSNGIGGIVYMPPGTYYLTNYSYYTNTSEGHLNLINITNDHVTLAGAGKNTTIVKLWPGAYGGTKNVFGTGEGTEGGGEPSITRGADWLTFQDFTFDGNRENQDYASDTTQFYGSSRDIFRNIDFVNINSDCIDAGNGPFVIENCGFSNVLGSAIHTHDYTPGITGHGIPSFITGFRMDRCGILPNTGDNHSAIELEGPQLMFFAGGWMRNCTNAAIFNGTIRFDDCVIYVPPTSDTNFWIDGCVLTLANCQFLPTAPINGGAIFAGGVFGTAGYLNVISCEFGAKPPFYCTNMPSVQIKNSQWAYTASFLACNGVKLLNNYINNGSAYFTGTVPSYGNIVMNNYVYGGKVRVEDGGLTNIIANNVFAGPTDYGIDLISSGGADGHRILNNYCDNIRTYDNGDLIRNNVFKTLTLRYSFCVNNSFIGNTISNIVLLNSALITDQIWRDNVDFRGLLLTNVPDISSSVTVTNFIVNYPVYNQFRGANVSCSVRLACAAVDEMALASLAIDNNSDGTVDVDIPAALSGVNTNYFPLFGFVQPGGTFWITNKSVDATAEVSIIAGSCQLVKER